ncbi:Homoserine dehydrogenase [Candidatus Promineifilum breve]|uniref:Homoserine dehydrogenase n=1 Tax=Candidatus Promineifilum breve TaxID=1806508 RepID=A0A170PGG6_9CHLR|nr:homoserine dehydrogenase [Candidatus Promineifilum breve]CUS03737.2 Homoserine dehydrogenase [Candidatus Promineifilum breve]
MRTYRLALIGFGNVGQGLATILRDHGPALAGQHGAEFRVVAVNTGRHGSIYNPEGFDPGALLAAYEQTKRVDTLAAPYSGWDVSRIIDESNADVIVELTSSDLLSGEPAAGYIRAAIRQDRHVVTTNKGPVALFYPELSAAAAERGVMLGVEGTVMGGTPLLRVGRDLLADAGVLRIQGILNGTTNYILTRMAEGESYKSALEEAQEKGYAEANPTADVDGYDAAIKIVILANLLLGIPLKLANVEREGIRELTSKDIVRAQKVGEVWKLVGWVERAPDMVKASVRPIRLPQSHPLASVSGAMNAVTFVTKLLGEVTITGPGAGRVETGYGVLSDLLELNRRMN